MGGDVGTPVKTYACYDQADGVAQTSQHIGQSHHLQERGREADRGGLTWAALWSWE